MLWECPFQIDLINGYDIAMGKAPPVQSLTKSHLIFTFLSFGINLRGVLIGDPRIAGIMEIMTK